MKKRLLLIALFSFCGFLTFAQISLVKTFPSNGGASTFEPLNNLIIFNATDGLWRSDGTTAGTTLLTPNAGFDRRSLRRCRVGNLIYFWASSGGTFNQLWKTDGTVSGTGLVKAFAEGREMGSMASVNGQLLFGFNTAATGTELWRSDGTETGTVIVVDLVAGSEDGVKYVSLPSAVLDGYFYFQGPADPALSGTGNIAEGRPTLYRTNGTAIGTTMVANGGYSPYGMTILGGRLIYQAYFPYSDTYGSPCFSSPTVATDLPTVLMKVENGVASMLKSPANVTFCGKSVPIGNTFLNSNKFIRSSNYLYFKGQTENNTSGQSVFNLWRTDGTSNGTIALTNFANGSNEGIVGTVLTDQFSISDFSFTDIAYFSIFTNATGSELWRSNGTVEGTYLLKDINPGTNGSGFDTGNSASNHGPTDFRTVNGVTYFFAENGTNGFELWRTDGTDMGTKIVQDLKPGAGSQSLVSFNDNVNGNSAGGIYYFAGDDTIDTGTGNGLYAVLPPEMYTVKAGNWNDPTIWSGNRLPLITDALTLNHAVTLPGSYISQAKRLLYSVNGRLLFSTDGQLKLGGN